MSTSKFKIIADETTQPLTFNFNRENLEKAKKIIKMYPSNFKESSIMPLLSIAQSQNHGWLPKKAIEYVSDFIEVPEIKVLEIATFYSMYNLSPVGKFHIEVCTTTPCMLRGSDSMLNLCKKKLGLKVDEITEDGLFSLGRVECLGACVNAPVVKINENYYEDLDSESLSKLLDSLKMNKKVKIGPQSNRKGSEPVK
tara:strand:- start:383 stop:973 length:591 start_codon:yes stop_codon:yes gene_type:complete